MIPTPAWTASLLFLAPQRPRPPPPPPPSPQGPLTTRTPCLPGPGHGSPAALSSPQRCPAGSWAPPSARGTSLRPHSENSLPAPATWQSLPSPPGARPAIVTKSPPASRAWTRPAWPPHCTCVSRHPAFFPRTLTASIRPQLVPRHLPWQQAASSISHPTEAPWEVPAQLAATKPRAHLGNIQPAPCPQASAERHRPTVRPTFGPKPSDLPGS